jgi:hypothetical protein
MRRQVCRPRTARRLTLVSVAVAAPLWTACASGASGGSGGGAAVAKAPAALCNQILAVLSDGPDPTADPVGYALSQILPLGQIHTSDRTVGGTLTRLIAADKELVKSNGGDRSSSSAITRADAALNGACPGVVP